MDLLTDGTTMSVESTSEYRPEQTYANMLDSLNGVYPHILVCRDNNLFYESDYLYKKTFQVPHIVMTPDLCVLCVQFIVYIAALVVKYSEIPVDVDIEKINGALESMHEIINHRSTEKLDKQCSNDRTLYILSYINGKCDDTVETRLKDTNMSKCPQLIQSELQYMTDDNINDLIEKIHSVCNHINGSTQVQIQIGESATMMSSSKDCVVKCTNVLKDLKATRSMPSRNKEDIVLKTGSLLRCAFKLLGIIKHLLSPFRVVGDVDYTLTRTGMQTTYNGKLEKQSLDRLLKDELLSDNISNVWSRFDTGIAGLNTHYNPQLFSDVYNFFKNIKENELICLWILAQQSVQSKTVKILYDKMNVRSFIRIRDVGVNSENMHDIKHIIKYKSEGIQYLEIKNNEYTSDNKENPSSDYRTYSFGPFDSIFTEDNVTNESITDLIQPKFDADIENSCNILMMGYGLSGAGKTSTLVQLGDDYGVFGRLLRKYIENQQVSEVKFIEDNTELSQFKMNYSTKIDFATFQTNLASASKSRKTKSTPNNAQSSRSSLIVNVTLRNNQGTLLNVCLADFAGYEQIFRCQDSNVLQLLNKDNIVTDDIIRDITNKAKSLQLTDDRITVDYWNNIENRELGRTYLKSYDYDPEIVMQCVNGKLQNESIKEAGVTRSYIYESLYNVCTDAALQMWAEAFLISTHPNKQYRGHKWRTSIQSNIHFNPQSNFNPQNPKPNTTSMSFVIELLGGMLSPTDNGCLSGHCILDKSADMSLYKRTKTNIIDTSHYWNFNNKNGDSPVTVQSNWEIKLTSVTKGVLLKRLDNLIEYLFSNVMVAILSLDESDPRKNLPTHEIDGLYYNNSAKSALCPINFVDMIRKRQHAGLVDPKDYKSLVGQTTEITKSLDRYAFIKFKNLENRLKHECDERNKEGYNIRETLTNLTKYLSQAINPKGETLAAIRPECIDNITPISNVPHQDTDKFNKSLPDADNTKIYIFGIIALGQTNATDKNVDGPVPYVPIHNIRSRLQSYDYAHMTKDLSTFITRYRNQYPQFNAYCEKNDIDLLVDGTNDRRKSNLKRILRTIHAYNSGSVIGVLNFLDSITKIGYSSEKAFCTVTDITTDATEYMSIFERTNKKPAWPVLGGSPSTSLIETLARRINKINGCQTTLNDGTITITVSGSNYTFKIDNDCEEDRLKILIIHNLLQIAAHLENSVNQVQLINSDSICQP